MSSPPSFFTLLIMGPKVEFWPANGEPQPEASRVRATARLTSEPVLQSPAYRIGRWPSCLPMPPPFHLHNSPWGEQGSPAAEQLAIRKMDYITLLSPRLARSACILSFFPPHPGISRAGEPQRHSRCSRLSPAPAVQFVQVYEHPDEENENRSIEAEPLV